MKPLHVLLIAALAPMLAQADDLPVAVDAGAFADAVATCKPSEWRSPHPFVRGFQIEHTLTGETEGRCDYTQTMPGGMHMACRLGEEGRAGLAGEFREQAAGRMSGGTGPQKAWTRDCELVAADGKRTPMGG